MTSANLRLIAPATLPVEQRTPAGLVFFRVIAITFFAKMACTANEHIDLLESRGLIVPDRERACHYLEYIGYYRLTGYFVYFQGGDSSHTFRHGASFDQVIDHYVFDRKLRLLLLDAIERVEVALRAAISDEMSLTNGPHWFTDSGMFVDGFDHEQFLRRLDGVIRENQHQKFIKHYRRNYNEPPYPPSWMVFEILSFGTVSRLYRNLGSADRRKAIAKRFGVDHHLLESWVHGITYTRNLCAHHARIWNRVFIIKSKVANRHKALVPSQNKVYAQAVVLYDLLKTVSPGSEWNDRLASLLTEHPAIPLRPMGFPEGWQASPFWK